MIFNIRFKINEIHFYFFMNYWILIRRDSGPLIDLLRTFYGSEWFFHCQWEFPVAFEWFTILWNQIRNFEIKDLKKFCFIDSINAEPGFKFGRTIIWRQCKPQFLYFSFSKNATQAQTRVWRLYLKNLFSSGHRLHISSPNYFHYFLFFLHLII